LLAAVRRNLKDARHDDISPESCFDIAYKSVMQCALIAVMANGFRPSTSEQGQRYRHSELAENGWSLD